MKLSSKSRYAVMAIVDMAHNYKDKPISLQSVADRQKIALNYLEQIFVKLRRGGVVNSVKGPGGGYILSRALEDIKLSDIIYAIDGSIKITRCTSTSNGCVGTNAKCLTHKLWAGLEKTIITYLNSVSLLEIVRSVENEKPAAIENRKEEYESHIL